MATRDHKRAKERVAELVGPRPSANGTGLTAGPADDWRPEDRGEAYEGPKPAADPEPEPEPPAAPQFDFIDSRTFCGRDYRPQWLIRRLLEYQKYKEAAQQLGQQPVVGRNVWSRGAAVEDAVGDGVDPDAIAPLAPTFGMLAS